MASTIVTGLHVEQDICFAKTPFGELFMTNGIDRGRKWDGVAAAGVVIGLDAPPSAPTVTEDNGGSSEIGDYQCAYRFGDAQGNYSDLSPITTVTTSGINKRFDWDTIPIASGTDSSARITKRQLFRTTVDEADIYYLVHEIADNSTTSYTASDTLSDETLSNQSELPVLNDDDSVNANRFGLPPTNKAVCVVYQDRMFYFADVVYGTGTVSVSNTGTAVTGSGTSFNRYMVGRYIYMVGDVVGYLITGYTSATEIAIAAHTGALSGVAYEIRSAPTDRNLIYFSEPEEFESVPRAQNNYLLQEEANEEDDLVGGYMTGAYLYLCQKNHTYAFSYTRQPHLDGGSALAFRRGLFNHNCHSRGVSQDGGAIEFCMDRLGPYAVVGGKVTDIGRALRNKFIDGTVTLSASRRFSVSVNQNTETAHFYIQTSADSDVTRSLTYNYALNRWSEDTYTWALGGGTMLETSSGQPIFYIGYLDAFHRENYSASADGGTTTVDLTVASIISNDIVSSSSGFTSAMVGMPLVVTSGSDRNATYKITAYTSGTRVTVSPTPLPAAGDTFSVRGISCAIKTGILDYPRNAMEHNERAIEVYFKPLDTSNSLPNLPKYIDIRHYMNYNTSPENAAMSVPQNDDQCAIDVDNPNGYVDIRATRNPDLTNPGWSRKLFSGRNAHGVAADRFISVELKFTATGEPVEISEIDIVGAK